MKKERIVYLFVIALLVALLAAAVTALTAGAAERQLNKYDVNADGQTDVNDVTKLLNYLAGGCIHRQVMSGELTPTCVSEGYRAHKVCALCGEALEQVTYIDKLPHAFSNWALTVEPTCTADGTETRVCAVCGEAETRAVAHPGHSFENGYCTRCGAIDVSAFTKGATVTFGAYEQNNKTSDGKEPIEWTVLETSNGKALLLSKYALDCQPYNTTKAEVTWETCTLRAWLNSTFFNEAFSDCEQQLIASTTLVNTHWGRGGNNTTDRVFMLGYDDIINEDYGFSGSLDDDDPARRCDPTAYAYAQGCSTGNSYKKCRWWVRFIGLSESQAMYVDASGRAEETGIFVEYTFAGVRPALWIDLTAGTVHDFGAWTLSTAASCTEEGVETHICEICGEAFTRPVAATGHHFEDGICTGCDLVDKSAIFEGATIKFGTYEQDNDTSNGKEDIEWNVLIYDEFDGEVYLLLLSKYGLDVQPYHDSSEYVTWDSCSLREWLNSDFLNAAFSDSERDMIEITPVLNEGNDEYGVSGGSDTREKVFIPDPYEVTYASWGFGIDPDVSDALRMCLPTEYSKALIREWGDDPDFDGNCLWWLRSPGKSGDYAATADKFGCVSSAGQPVDSRDVCVRPAMWIKLPADLYRHKFGDWTTVTAPTCWTSGEEKHICKTCGAVETRPIASTGHHFVNEVCTLCGFHIYPGAIIPFGTYEQDFIEGNGREAIEWTVLDVVDGKALLLSNYALEARQYDQQYRYVTWEECTLRNWLNGYFYDTAFDSAGKAKIVSTTLVNDDGSSTTDRVFLPSLADMTNPDYDFTTNRYAQDPGRLCDATAYAIAWGSQDDAEDSVCAWWLRSTNAEDTDAPVVIEDGSILDNDVDFVYGVRPAIWIEI